jgi:hypothetical protein
MARPRKKATELTNDEAMAKLFPKRAITRAKKEAEKADSQATKKESKE